MTGLKWLLCSVFMLWAGIARSDETVRVCVGKVCYAARLAQTDETRTRGLMYRETLPSGQAMLFVFDQPAVLGFWMKNMKFAIDIVWLSQDRKIVDIAAVALPCRREPCKVYYPGAEAMYVLEIPAGDTRRYGWAVGDRLEWSAAQADRVLHLNGKGE